MNFKLTTIINYCTNDYRYLDLCIESVKPFSTEIILPVCDHFFNGDRENRHLLNLSYQNHPECKFIEYSYPKTLPNHENSKHFLHSVSRYVGYHHASCVTEFVLFLDIDEIVDSNRFIEWLNTQKHLNRNACRFYSYFYFREDCYRAKDIHPLNALLIKKSALDSPNSILTIAERLGLYLHLEPNDQEFFYGIDGTPLIHHYSWVRTKNELEKKVVTWGHAHEKNWLRSIQEEYDHEFILFDFIHFFHYEKIEPLHTPLLKEVPLPSFFFDEELSFNHVVKFNLN